MKIDPLVGIGTVSLTVSNLQRSVDFYTDRIGLSADHDAANPSLVRLSADGVTVLRLLEQPGALAWPRNGRSYTGLYHFALLLPTRAALGQWLQHWLDMGLTFPGQADHLVSEALYLEDPDNHGIEIYADRPRSQWKWNGSKVQMSNAPLDIQSLLQDGRGVGPWAGMLPGTTVGHIHLQVSSIEETERFYTQKVGMDLVARAPSALFMSGGGYHHHIGANVWHSLAAPSPPEECVKLVGFNLEFSTEEKRAEFQANTGFGLSFRDPSNIEIELTVRP